MKAKKIVYEEIEIVTLQVKAEVRYWEDSKVNGSYDINGDLMPCRVGNEWCPEIDIDTGVIRNWTQGVKAEVHYKVRDQGEYLLLDKNGVAFDVSIYNGYVPKIMCPDENGFGDYIIMSIDENGKIANWKPYIKDFNGVAYDE